MTHHAVISKAGGATTQEAIAARCPMIVNQIVPGQEEGNYELLRRHGAGALAETPEAALELLRRLFEGRGRLWRVLARGASRRSRARTRRRRSPPRSSRRRKACDRAPTFHRRPRIRMKTCFIFNPHSGRQRRNARLLPLLRDFIASQRLEAELRTTEGPGHATILAREAVAAGCGRVVAVGGDGTMNEVAQALVRTPAALALVPCGSGNGLARHLGLPTCPCRALALLARGDAGVAIVDTGTAAGLPFFNAMGLGLDAEVSRRFNQLERAACPPTPEPRSPRFAPRRPSAAPSRRLPARNRGMSS